MGNFSLSASFHCLQGLLSYRNGVAGRFETEFLISCGAVVGEEKFFQLFVGQMQLDYLKISTFAI